MRSLGRRSSILLRCLLLGNFPFPPHFTPKPPRAIQLTTHISSGFDATDTWGHRAAEPNKAVICSIALARLRTDVRGSDSSASANSNAVGMAQKLLLFWRKPARRCWWEGVELSNVEGVEDGAKLKVWIRRVWTLEMVSPVFPRSRVEWQSKGARLAQQAQRSRSGERVRNWLTGE